MDLSSLLMSTARWAAVSLSLSFFLFLPFFISALLIVFCLCILGLSILGPPPIPLLCYFSRVVSFMSHRQKHGTNFKKSGMCTVISRQFSIPSVSGIIETSSILCRSSVWMVIERGLTLSSCMAVIPAPGASYRHASGKMDNVCLFHFAAIFFLFIAPFTCTLDISGYCKCLPYITSLARKLFCHFCFEGGKSPVLLFPYYTYML